MMFYHDGLRTLDAEKARHSSKTRAPALIFTPYLLISNALLIFFKYAGAFASCLFLCCVLSNGGLSLIIFLSIWRGYHDEPCKKKKNQLEAVSEPRP
jgi:hypothetical protein